MSLQSVDRGIYEQLRKKVVALGFLPEITNYNSQDAYAAAKVTLRESLVDKTIIDVFGVGSSQSRQEKTDSKIVIDRVGLKESSTITYGGTKYYKNQDDTFTKVKLPDTPYDVDYEIRIISTTAKMDRILNNIVLSVCGSTGKYIPMMDGVVQSSTDGFLIKFNGSVDITKDVFIERVFRITAQEVWLVEEEVLKSNVPMLIEVIADIIPVVNVVELETAKKEDDGTVAVLVETNGKVVEKVELDNIKGTLKDITDDFSVVITEQDARLDFDNS